MAIKRTFNGKTLIHPGAFSKIIVENLSGFPLAETGIVAIVGEAIGGEPRVLDILSKEGIQDAKARYKSGPISDALGLLTEPSKDPRIANGASKVIVYKVNASLQSQLNLQNGQTVPLSQVLLKSKNWGGDENLLNALLSAGAVADADAQLTGSIDGPFVLAGGETLILKINATTYTFTNTLVGSTTAAALVVELNTVARWSGSIKPVIASAVGLKIKIVIDPVVVVGGEKDYGYILVDAACTLDTIVGITGTNRGLKSSRVLTLKKGSDSEVSPELGGVAVMSIKYVGAGTSSLLTLQKVAGALKLTTVCAGAAADNLDIVLVDAEGKIKHTVRTLVDLIDAHASYEASTAFSNPAISAGQLDFYSGLEISLVAGVLQRDVFALVDHVSILSALAVASKLDNIYRELKTFVVVQFFTGAADGASVNSDWVAGLEAFKEERINCVVPLISEDAGVLTVDSINAAAQAHGAAMWATDGKSERHIFLSRRGLKAAAKAAAMAINSEFCSMTAQEPKVLNRQADLVFLQPWAAACIAAGMRAGAEVGEPLTFKFLNVNDMRVPLGDWSPKKDFSEMLEAGLLIAERVDSGGFRWIVGNTTYSKDQSFVFNRESVMQAAGFVAYDLRLNLEQVFTGTKAKTGTAEAIANFIRARMSLYLGADIIVGDDLNDDLGYRDDTLRVTISGNTAAINVSITPVQGIDFILPTIFLADIRQSA